jgi:transcriptional regulator with XRE-family HTH domain
LQRELKGRVLSRVAKDAGISVSLLHDWHSSARAPSAKNLWHLWRLAEYLGLSLEEILFDEMGGKQFLASLIFSDRGVRYRLCVEKLKS